MNRPITLSEYSNWMQIICAEAAVVARENDQLVARVEKIATAKENLAHRVHDAKRQLQQLDRQIEEEKKIAQPVRECLIATEQKLDNLKAENKKLKQQMAEVEARLATAAQEAAAPKELSEELERERAKLRFLTRMIAQSMTPDKAWDLLPSVLEGEDLSGAIEAIKARGTSAWDELLKVEPKTTQD